MKKVSRRNFLKAAGISVAALGLAACGGSSAPAASSKPAAGSSATGGAEAGSFEQMTITVAHSLFEDGPEHQNLLAFAEEMSAKTGGAVTVQIYPNSTLGGETTAIESTQGNNITMCFANAATLSNYVPQCEIFDIPFLFGSSEASAAVLNDEGFVQTLDDACGQVGIKLVGTSVTGFRWMTANKPVNSYEDMKGLKIRTMQNNNHMLLWNSLGCNATPMSGAELFTALQQGTVDGQENPISTIHDGKIYEVNSYLVDTRHILSVSVWIVNPDWYNGLSDGLRAVFDEAIATCTANVSADNASQEAERIETLKGLGMTVVVPDDAWRASMEAAVGDSVEKQVRADIGDEMVDAILTAAGK